MIKKNINNMTCTVLLTGINSSPALNVIRYLRKQKKYDVNIVGCDITEYTAGRLLVDRFFKIPRFNSKDLLPTLLKICQREKVNIMIPIFEPELRIISENRELFQNQGVKIVLPSKEVVRLCLDKEATLKFFFKNNIPTCRLYTEKRITPQSYPLFLKPKVGNSSHGIRIIYNQEELKNYYSPSDHLLCELLEGEEFTIDVYCQKPGKVTCLLARKRIETTDGMTTRGETYEDPQLFHYCKKIMAMLNYEGVCCLQCIYDQNYRFFEINPRIGGSSNLTFEAGYNIPLYILDDFYGRKIRLPKKPKKLYMVKYYKDAYWET